VTSSHRGNVHVVKANQHANKALFTLLKENILSCPVYDDELQVFLFSLSMLLSYS
jgi:hypothetical protein